MKRGDDTDAIAREAARLLETGQHTSIDEAIDAATGALNVDAPRPTWGRVRQHAEGFALQARGPEERDAAVRAIWKIAEELMTILEDAFLDTRTVLVGRAARGQIDAGVIVYLRVYTREPMTAVVDVLDEQGCGEPAFESVRTRFGRLDRVRFEEDGWEVVVTRCAPEQYADRREDLVRGVVVVVVTLAELRKQLARVT